ncbi:MAG: type II toxin-antitoxin system Phd/YefM family antitoxin [Nitrospirota bacterium]
MVKSGEEVIIASEGSPVARLVPVDNCPAERVPGTAKGKIIFHGDFTSPLPDDIIDSFYK